jgi:hypothetical protein
MKRRACLLICVAFSVPCVILTLLAADFHVDRQTESAAAQTSNFTINDRKAHSALPPLMPPVTSLATVAVSPQKPVDKSWRRTNRLVVEYQPELAARLSAQASRMTAADDPEVIQLARDVIDPVPMTAPIGIKRSREIVKTPQAEAVETITGKKVNEHNVE